MCIVKQNINSSRILLHGLEIHLSFDNPNRTEHKPLVFKLSISYFKDMSIQIMSQDILFVTIQYSHFKRTK